MSYIKPLMEIEIKNKNQVLYFISLFAIYILLSALAKFDKVPYYIKFLNLSLVSFVFIGLIMSIAFIESVKNDQDSKLIKTYITYPFSTLNYVFSKLLIFIIMDIIILIFGSITSFFIIGYMNINVLELLLFNSFYIIFSIISIALISVTLSRFNILSEIVTIFYYLIVLVIALSSISIKTVLKLFPFFYYFQLLLHFKAGYNISNLIFMPLLFIVFIILALMLFMYFKWKILYNFK